MRALLSALLLGLACPAAAASLPPGAPLTAPFAEALLQRALEGRGAGDRFQITLEQPALPLGNTASLTTEITLEQFRYEAAARRFHGALVGTVEGRPRFRLPVAGRAEPVVRVPALSRPVRADEIIGAADLTWVELVEASVPPAALREPEEIVGSQARRRLAPGRVLTPRDLGPPHLVRRGQPVELIYARPGLRITALGVAQEDGALGDLVQVINAESRRQLRGVVSGPGEVSFTGAAAR